MITHNNAPKPEIQLNADNKGYTDDLSIVNLDIKLRAFRKVFGIEVYKSESGTANND